MDGIVVLDLTQALSGPICTCVLADYGAKVIKVEAPNKADMTRAKNYDVTLPIDPDTGGDNFYAINRNKYGICVDNRSEKGKKILRDLASKVDVLVSNYRPGVTKKIGIDYETLREINPRLICCEISAFREKDRVNDPAFDVVVQAASGILASTGYPDAPPAKVGASITDISAGINAVQGILLALLERDKTGRGQLVTVKMQDAAMFLMAQYVTPCVADPT
ncbi:MAG: CoA transferase, partial [Oscillospiraceae bacterium]|nr:CoA transferase [Oscillospiraceae bacterium]